MKRALHDELEDVDVERLGVEIPRAQAHGLDRAVAIRAPGNHNDLGARLQLQQLFQGSHAFAYAIRIRRQTEVLQNHARLEAPHLSDRFGARACLEHFV